MNTFRLDAVSAPMEYYWNNATGGVIPFVRRTVDAFRRPVVVRSCTASGALTITYAGLGDGIRHGLTYLEEQCAMLTGERVQRTVRYGSWPQVLDLARHGAAETDLLVIGAPRQWFRPMAGDEDLIAPMRIHYLVELGATGEPFRNRVSRKDLQRFRKRERERDWNLEVRTDEPAFWEFYERMHLPTMQRRHGKDTRSESLRVARYGLFRKGVVCFVREGDRRVAGVVCREENARRKLLMRLAGVRDADDKHYKSGVFLALYILTLEWAAQNGFRSVEMSGSEPFVNKGLYQFKRKLDPCIVVPDTHYRDKRLWIRFLSHKKLLLDLLERNPLVCQSPQGELEVVFFENASSASTRKRSGWTTANIDRFRTVSLEAPSAPSRPGAPGSDPAGAAGRVSW